MLTYMLKKAINKPKKAKAEGVGVVVGDKRSREGNEGESSYESPSKKAYLMK